MIIRPFLASSEIPNPIRFPVIASPKIDGVRGMCHDCTLMSRNWRVIPNQRIIVDFNEPILHGLDGELAVGSRTAKNLMQNTTSGVMSEDGFPDYTYWVFDYYTSPTVPYKDRLLNLEQWFQRPDWSHRFPRIKLLEWLFVENQEQLDAYEEKCLAEGFEGVICRSLDGPYKPMLPGKGDRSTAREGYMFKLKRFIDGEAVVTGYEEFYHNANAATVGPLGKTERSSHQANKIPMGKLGAFLAKDIKTHQIVRLGTGFTDEQRRAYWLIRDEIVKNGWIAKYKHFNHGVKEKPRHPVFLGFRDKRDM